MSVFFGLPLPAVFFKTCNAVLSYIASFVIGFTPALTSLDFAVPYDIPSNFAISVMVKPFILPISASIHQTLEKCNFQETFFNKHEIYIDKMLLIRYNYFIGRQQIMWESIDISGRRYGRLVALKIDHVKKYKSNNVEYWLCQCDCGNTKVIAKPSLTTGLTTSCGKRDVHNKHGKTGQRLFKIWSAMLDRCENKNNHAYERYGGRGISVCQEWHDIESFYAWALSNGYTENLTIDRIDNNGNYEPSNCRWATRKEQNNNTSNNRLIEYNGEIKTIAQWSEILGIKHTTLSKRLIDGWSAEKALTVPVRKNKNGKTGVRCIEGRYRSYIQTGGEKIYLGTFDTVEEANAAYVNAKNRKAV